MGYIPQDDGEFNADAYAQSLLSGVSARTPLNISEDEDYAIRTIIGEARSQNAVGRKAVAGVIRNRANGAKQSYKDIVLAKSQFEPWSHTKTRNAILGIGQDSPIYQQIAQTVLPVLRGEEPDPTNGATHFYAPKAQRALGRPTPDFDNGKGFDIGDHRFFNLGYSGKGRHGTKSTTFDPNAYAQTLLGQVSATESLGDEFNPDEYAQQLLGSTIGDVTQTEPEDAGTIYGQPADNYVGESTPPQTVTEHPDTIQAQIIAASDPKVKGRVGVLVTSPEQNQMFGNTSGFAMFPTPDGRNIWVNTDKAKKILKLKSSAEIEQFLAMNPLALERLTGTATKVEDTSQGATVLTTLPNGVEASAKIVTDPQSAVEQIALDKESFPDGTSQIVDAQEVVDKRLAPVADEYGNSLPLANGVTPLPNGDDLIIDMGANEPSAPTKPVAKSVAKLVTKPTVTKPVTKTVKPKQDEPFDEKQFKAANDYLAEQGQPLLSKEQYQSAIKSFKGGVSVSLPNVGEVDGQTVVGSNYREPVELKEIQAKDAGGAFADVIDIPDTVKTPEQASEYAIKYLQAKYPDGQFSGGNFPKGWEVGDGQIGVTYDTLKGAGVDVEPEIRKKVVENRVENPKPDLRVGRDWAKEDAEALNKAIGGIPAGFLATTLNAGGNTAKALAGLMKMIGDLNPAKLDSMSQAAGEKPYRAGGDIVKYLRGIAESTGSLAANTGNKYTEIAGEDEQGTLPGRPVEKDTWATKGAKAIGALADLPRLALLPGGVASPILSFAADSALQAAAEGENVDWDKVKKEGAKGAALGAVSMIAPGIGKGLETGVATVANRASSNVLREGLTLGTLAGGTYAASRALGDTPQQAFDNAVLFSAFHAIGVAKKAGKDIRNTPIRVKDTKGNEAVIEIKKDGKIITLDPIKTEAKAQIEIPEDVNIPKPEISKGLQTEVNAANKFLNGGKDTPKTEAVKPEVEDVAAESTQPKDASIKTENIDIKEPVKTKTESVKAPETITEVDLGKAAKAEVAKDVEVLTEPVADRTVGTDKPQGKPSKVGLDVEAKAVAKGLTEAFGETAEYNAVNVKEQAKRAVDLVYGDLEKARNIVNGKEALPQGLRAAPLIDAMERFARKNGDAKLIKELAQSPLVSDTSLHAQEMRLMRERHPYSVSKQVADILAVRKKDAGRKYDQVKLDREVQDVLTQLDKTNKELEVKQAASESRIAQMHTEMTLKDLQKSAHAPAILKAAENIVAKLETRADSARERLAKRGNVFQAGIDPVALKDLAEIGAAHLGRVGLDFAKFSERMIGEYGEKIKPHLKSIYDKANKILDGIGDGKRVLTTSAESSLKAIKTRLESQIRDLETSIQKREKIVREPSKIEYDAEANSLKARRDELKEIYDQVFAQQGPDLNQRLETWRKLTGKRIDELQGKIEKGDYEPSKRASAIELDAPAQALGARRDALKIRLQKLRQLTGEIGEEEIKSLSDFANKADAAKAALDKVSKDSPEYEDIRRDFGRADYDFKATVDDLKLRNAPIKPLGEVLRHPLSAMGETIGKGVGKGAEIVRHPINAVGRGIKATPGTSKAIQASMDNSAVFRQGWRTMWTHPGIWARNGAKSFQNLFGKYGGRAVERELYADLNSRENALNGRYKKSKLDIGMSEEAFPTALPEKVPMLGRAYKRTEAAYTAFVQKTRADVFDKYIDIAEKTGVELAENELRRIGELVNALTGRGDLGSLEKAGKAVNNVFFSPKFLASHIDTVTQAFTGQSTAKLFNSGETGSKFVQRQAAKNLAKVIVGQAAVVGIAKALAPNAVTLDPRSSDFGKIRVGNTRFDITGGMGSLMVLSARLLTGESKSASGKVTDLASPGYGGKSRLDALLDFGQNKLSPIGNVLRDVLAGETRDFKKPTVLGEATKLVTPLPLNNAIEVLKDPTASNVQRVVAILADAMGIATNTYGNKEDSRVSADAKAVQQKAVKIAPLMDKLQMAQERGEDDTALKEQLKAKLDNKLDSGGVTDAEAERANKLLGTDEYYGQVENEAEPQFGKYNKNADTFIEKVSTWAEAIGTDPVDAFDKLFAGEYIARMENGAIIVRRMSLADSQKERQRLGGGGKAVKLEHLLPLALGGTNDPSNLRLVTTEEHDSWTPIEVYLAGALHDKKIDKAKAKQLILDLKEKKISREDVVREVGEPFTHELPVSDKRQPKTRGLKMPSLKMPSLR